MEARAITLGWKNPDGGDETMELGVYGANFYDIELLRAIHPLLNGGLAQDGVGFRYKMSVEFWPLLDNKSQLYQLQSFMLGSQRSISYNLEGVGLVSRDVVPENDLGFTFLSNVFYGNAFTMSFIERGLRQTSDDGTITKVLIPTYSGNIASIDTVGTEERLTISVNLFDPDSIDTNRKMFEFLFKQAEDKSFSFRHRYLINFGVIESETIRQWLVDFALWQNRKLDTRNIDGDEGGIFSVIVEEGDWKYAMQGGVEAMPSISLTFVETVPRTQPQVIFDPFIIDRDTVDSKVLGE